MVDKNPYLCIINTHLSSEVWRTLSKQYNPDQLNYTVSSHGDKNQSSLSRALTEGHCPSTIISQEVINYRNYSRPLLRRDFLNEPFLNFLPI